MAAADRCPLCGSDQLINDGSIVADDGAVIAEMGTCAKCGAVLRYERGELHAWTWQVWRAEQLKLLEASVGRGKVTRKIAG